MVLSWWRTRVGLGLGVLLGVFCWGNHLTDHVGYGASLLVALYASTLSAITGAALGRRAHAQPTSPAVAALMSLFWVALPTLVVLARGLVAPACGPAGGARFVLLIPLPGAVLAGLLGYALGVAIERPRWATALAALMPLATIVWSLARFYGTPGVFAYDPFFGFYPGALYDERVPVGLTLVSYRLGTLGWVVAAAALGHALRLALRGPRGAPQAGWRGVTLGTLVSGLAGLALGLGVYLAGPALGHRLDAETVASRLGASTASGRCVVRYDRTLDPRQAWLTARDCALRVAQLEDFYGVRVAAPITVFLFASSAQKAALMGAADTYIAKPWRREVYLQYAPFPHPVLKHELAHVVAGAMASGPFRVTMRGRWLPVPGLIEGAAVAAAWEGDGGDSSPHQWSRAMLEAGLAPRVSSLASLAFFMSASATAYTAAGSFCRWLHDTRGVARFQRLYATADFEGVYGASLPALEAEWHRFLRTVETPERVLVRAQTRFRRASIFGRECPFALEDLSEQSVRQLHAGALAEAAAGFEVLQARDPTDLRARTGAALVRVRRGQLAEADQIATRAAEALGPAAGQRIRSAVADAVWRYGEGDEALARYNAIAVAQLDEDEARTLSLKRRALGRGGLLAEAVADLLVGRGAVDASTVAAAVGLERARCATGDPVATYLVARQLFLTERFGAAVALLDDATLARLEDPRVRAEARRIRGTSYWHLWQMPRARADFEALAADPERPQGLRDVAADWCDRIDREGRARASSMGVPSAPR